MNEIFLLKLGEIVLKGQNRKQFENKLRQNVRRRMDKHETVLEDGAFIGCHTSLVAPVRVGQGAYIGAGSVITQDGPAGALGVARSRQTNKKEWANRHKK